MGAFVALFQRDGAPVGPTLVRRLLAPLSHRGADGSNVLVEGPIGLGSQAFWTTPEEVGEHQPVVSPEGGLAVFFDGRLDNRTELLAWLGFDTPSGRAQSDAAIFLRGFLQLGEDFFRRTLGPWAACIADLVERRLILARDPMGDRTLVYHCSPRLLAVASEEGALLEHPKISDELDEQSLALHFAIRPPAPGRTLFAQVHEVLPGELIVVDRESARSSRFWRPPAEGPSIDRSEVELAEELRELLKASVSACLRTTAPPVAFMSGGLDSTTVTALAATARHRQGYPAPLRTISWVFDEVKVCDERRWMDGMVQAFGLDPVRFVADALWPLGDGSDWTGCRNGPEVNPFRPLKSRGYREAASRGHRVALIGASGDLLYSRWTGAFLSLLHNRQFRALSAELALSARRWGVSSLWRHSSSRHLVGHVLRHLPFAERVRRDSRSAVEAWLTPHARRLAAQADDAIVHEERAGSAIHPAFSLRASQGSSREVQLAARQGIEPRDPYRDRRLAEFMLRVPAHMLLRDGRLKHLVRAAMYGILPEGVRLRVTPTQLDPLLRRGLVEREGKMLQDLLDQGRDLWAPFVKPNKLQHIVETELPAGRKDAVALVPWNCAAFCLWPFNRASAGASTSSASARGEAVIEDRPLPVSRDAEKPIAPPRTYSPPAVEHVEPLHVAVLGGSPGGTDSGGTPEYPPTVPTPPAPRPGGTSEEGMPTAWEPSAWEPPPQEPPAQPVQPWGPPETPSL